MKISDIAGACHEVNRALCQFNGDFTQRPWNEASAWQVESACHGVAALLQDTTLTTAEQHELWVQHKLDNGWRWGPIKDEGKKHHPCILPYDQLPEQQRLKDILFQANARYLLQFMVRGQQDTYSAEQVKAAIDDEDLTGELTNDLWLQVTANRETFVSFCHTLVNAVKVSIADRLGLTVDCTCGSENCKGPMSATCGLVQAELEFAEAQEDAEADVQHVAEVVGTKVADVEVVDAPDQDQ